MQQQICQAFLVILTIGGMLFAINTIMANGWTSIAFGAIGSTLVFAVLLVLYVRGLEVVRYITVVMVTLGVFIVSEPFVTHQFAPAILVAPVVALVLAGPAWVVGSAISVIVIMLFRAGGVGVYTDPANLTVITIVIGGISLGRLMSDRAQHQAEMSAQEARDALAHSEVQAQTLVQLNQQATLQIEEQRRLIDLVGTLETPVVQLANGVLFAPLVGHLDTRRTQTLTTRLLESAYTQRARLIVIDIAGVPMVDTAVARALLDMTQALRLLGCDVNISGISPDVAILLTQLGISMDGITTVRTPQEALALRR
jgi:anti-anti-sigma regulatory factor